MFIALRPVEEDDPYFAVRLAIMPVLGLVIGIALRSPMASIFPVLTYALMATNRKAFDPGRVLGAPILFSLSLWLTSGLVLMLQGVPLVLLTVIALILFLAFYLIQRTGNAAGILIIVSTVLMSIMALGSYQSMAFLRSEMTKACLATAIVSPFLYAMLPVRTREKNVDEIAPAYPDGWATRAAIRTVVMFGYCFALYTFLNASNIFLAVAGMFVLAQSNPKTVWGETRLRITSVLLGGVIGVGIVAILQQVSHFTVIAALVFLATLWLAQNILTGPGNYRLYHEAGTVMLSLVGGVLSNSEPGYAFFQRAVLTVVSTLVAAWLISVLDAALVLRREKRDVGEVAPQ